MVSNIDSVSRQNHSRKQTAKITEEFFLLKVSLLFNASERYPLLDRLDACRTHICWKPHENYCPEIAGMWRWISKSIEMVLCRSKKNRWRQFGRA